MSGSTHNAVGKKNESTLDSQKSRSRVKFLAQKGDSLRMLPELV
jgi:hypothetical protein